MNSSKYSRINHHLNMNIIHILFRNITLIILVMIYTSSADLLSPVRNLESSLAAAAAHGTIVAVTAKLAESQNDNEIGSDMATIILTRSPTVRSNLTLDFMRNHGYDEEDDDSIEDMFRSQLLIGPVPTTAGMVHLLHSSLAVGMTGFASDVRYLSRFLANLNVNFEHLHGRSSSSAAGSLSALKATRALSSKLSNVAMISGARPYGVEAIIVGPGSICTVDPSGCFHRWNKASAIGKYSQQIRKRLTALLTSEEADDNTEENRIEYPTTIKDALECAFQAILHAHKEAVGDFNNMSAEQFECIIIWSKDCYDINSKCMKYMYDRCIEDIPVDG